MKRHGKKHAIITFFICRLQKKSGTILYKIDMPEPLKNKKNEIRKRFERSILQTGKRSGRSSVAFAPQHGFHL